MGRDATKAAGNPWYQARKKAAEYDDRLDGLRKNGVEAAYDDFADAYPHTHGNETDTLLTVSGDS